MQAELNKLPVPSSQLPLLLRGGEVARLLGISRALAFRWMQQGVLPTVRHSKTVRVPSSALLEWIEDNTRKTTMQSMAKIS